jgi:hypothetical protein
MWPLVVPLVGSGSRWTPLATTLRELVEFRPLIALSRTALEVYGGATHIDTDEPQTSSMSCWPKL